MKTKTQKLCAGIIMLSLIIPLLTGCNYKCKQAGDRCAKDTECCSADCIGIPCEAPDQCIISPHCSQQLKKIGEYCSSNNDCEHDLVCKPRIIDNVSTFRCGNI